MPIYEYQCQTCGHELEEMQKFSDEPLTVCPKCGNSSLHKKISATGFQLKGTGWYATDFKDKKPAPAADTEAAKTESSADTSAAKKDEKKTGGTETNKESN